MYVHILKEFKFFIFPGKVVAKCGFLFFKKNQLDKYTYKLFKVTKSIQILSK